MWFAQQIIQIIFLFAKAAWWDTLKVKKKQQQNIVVVVVAAQLPLHPNGEIMTLFDLLFLDCLYSSYNKQLQ